MNGVLVSVLDGVPLRPRCENELGFKMVKWSAAIELVHDFADLCVCRGATTRITSSLANGMPI